jgi:hypothetical protein
MSIYWIESTSGDTCEEVCARGASGLPSGMKPVKAGKWSGNGNPFKVCAGGDGPRPGYQLSGFNDTTCRVPQGDDELEVGNFYCLCSINDADFV